MLVPVSKTDAAPEAQMDITTATPAEIDAEIARLEAEYARAYAILDRKASTPAAREQASRDAQAAREALNPLNAEFERRGGWNRYFLVEGGHLHYDVSSYRCSRTITTRHYWPTELADLPVDEVVALAGERACTVCFPGAPVAVLKRPSKLQTKSEAEQVAAAAERAQKRSEAAKAKAAKAIVDPETGGELVVNTYGWAETIKTERAAAIELVNQLWYQKYYSDPQDRDAAVAQLLAALAAKRGTTIEEERAAAEKRLAARIKREG
jgi:hypothetical protein